MTLVIKSKFPCYFETFDHNSISWSLDRNHRKLVFVIYLSYISTFFRKTWDKFILCESVWTNIHDIRKIYYLYEWDTFVLCYSFGKSINRSAFYIIEFTLMMFWSHIIKYLQYIETKFDNNIHSREREFKLRTNIKQIQFRKWLDTTILMTCMKIMLNLFQNDKELTFII